MTVPEEEDDVSLFHTGLYVSCRCVEILVMYIFPHLLGELPYISTKHFFLS